MVHERTSLSKNNILNNYLAAKASSFIISGISGIENAPQAIFIRYANKIVYVPSLLKQKKFRLKINPIGSVSNDYVNPDNKPNMIDAYARTKNTMAKLRTGITFNAYR